jgi:hypothetical protein
MPKLKRDSEMRIGVIVALTIILVAVLLLLFYAPEPTLEILTTELDNGVRVENIGNVDCLVFITSLEGQQRFELPTGQSIIVTNITKPVEVSTVSK